jgi:hypothetical protein
MYKEIWKDIRNFPDYKISNYGRVKSYKHKKPIILKPALSEGYEYVNLFKENKSHLLRIHILVLENFVSKKPKNKQAHYIDFNKLNNKVDNLKWATRTEIIKNIVKTGKMILTENEIIENFKKGKFNHSHTYRKIEYKYKLLKDPDKGTDKIEDEKIIKTVKNCKKYSYNKAGKLLNLTKEWVRQVMTRNGYFVVKYLLINGKTKAKRIIAGRGKYKMGKQIKVSSLHKKQLQTAVKNLNRIIKAIRKYIPNASIFFNGEEKVNLNIHKENMDSKNWEDSLIFNAGNIEHSDCGGYQDGKT